MDDPKAVVVRGQTMQLGPYVVDDRMLLLGPLPKIRDVTPTIAQKRAPARPTPLTRLRDVFTIGPDDPARSRRHRRPGLGLVGKPSEGETLPPPRRMTSLGNGLVIDWKVSAPEAAFCDPFWDEFAKDYDPGDMSTWTPRQPRHHAIGLEATLRQGDDGFFSYAFTGLWVADDDSGWASYGMHLLQPDWVASGEWLNEGFRVLCLAPMIAGNRRPEEFGDDLQAEWSLGLMYAAVAIADDWGPRGGLVEEWAISPVVLLGNLTFDLEYWRERGFRPISIRGVGVPLARGDGDNPEYVRCQVHFASVLVRDNIGPDEWKVLVDLKAVTFANEQAAAWADGFRTISITAYNNEGELRYTAVLVRDTSGENGGPSDAGDWEYRSGLTAESFQEENEQFRTKGWQLVTFACHPLETVPEGLGITNAKDLRFSGVWRVYARRRLTVAPGAYARDQATFDLFASILPAEMMLNRTGAAALAIMQDSELLFSAAYTWAPEGMEMMRREKPIRLGSVAKSIATLCILEMMDQGIQVPMKDGTLRELDFDLEVFRALGMSDLPETPPQAPEVDLSWAYLQLTLGRLLSQVSGFRDQVLATSDRSIARRLGVSLPLSHRNLQDYVARP